MTSIVESNRAPLLVDFALQGGGAHGAFTWGVLDRLLDVPLGRWTLDHSPVFVAMDLMARVFSPYDLSPGGANPLRNILAETVDFGRLARASIKLFVTATNVRTGRGQVFRNSEITPDVLLASACLPTLFQAIEIDGES